MSWKNELPAIAFEHAEKMENELEILKKEKQQRAFQLPCFESIETVINLCQQTSRSLKRSDNCDLKLIAGAALHLRIETAGLTLKPAKCQWLGRLVKFLGHIVPEEGVTVDPAKVSSVKNFPIPQNKTDVRRFLGLTGYYRRFIANYASRSKPLVDLTKKKRLFQRTKDADNVFQELKNCLISAPVLQCPDASLQFKLYTDACDYGLGAVLAQETDDGETVIAYANRILKPSEAKYSVLQKEALGIVWALKYFYPYLYGRHFTIVTDHRPLKWLRTMDAPNNLFARWISEIQGRDICASSNAVDCRSRTNTKMERPKSAVLIQDTIEEFIENKEAFIAKCNVTDKQIQLLVEKTDVKRKSEL
eukprot:gene18342-20185_t